MKTTDKRSSTQAATLDTTPTAPPRRVLIDGVLELSGIQLASETELAELRRLEEEHRRMAELSTAYAPETVLDAFLDKQRATVAHLASGGTPNLSEATSQREMAVRHRSIQVACGLRQNEIAFAAGRITRPILERFAKAANQCASLMEEEAKERLAFWGLANDAAQDPVIAGLRHLAGECPSWAVTTQNDGGQGVQSQLGSVLIL